MISKTLTIFVLGLLLAVAAHGEPRLVDHEGAAPEPARLLKGSKGGKSFKGKGSSRLLKASKSKSEKSGSARYLKGSKSGKSCKGTGKGSDCGKGTNPPPTNPPPTNPPPTNPPPTNPPPTNPPPTNPPPTNPPPTNPPPTNPPPTNPPPTNPPPTNPPPTAGSRK